MHDKTMLSVPVTHRSLLLPILLSLLAFAANSVFCRLALRDGAIDATAFTAIRLGSGAVVLAALVYCTRRPCRPAGSWAAGLALFAYAWLFSLAYLQLGAGTGALILFGAVQVSMFGIGLCRGEPLQRKVLLGMLIAFAGLLALLLPGIDAPPLASALVMLGAGVAWGVYSLLGKGSADPLAATAGNFLRSLPLVLVAVVAIALSGASLRWSGAGVLYALGSGVLASGAGYSLWYSVVKHISSQQAATMQLSVPVLAALGGVLLLGEPLTWRLGLSSLVVLGGVAMALLPTRRG
nr:DMT family transporter [uncultured Pseudomonas sp.]